MARLNRACESVAGFGGVAAVAGGVLVLASGVVGQTVSPELFESPQIALERGPLPSDWSNLQVGRDGRPQLPPSAPEVWFGDQRYSVFTQSDVLEPGRYDRLPATGGALRLVSGDYRVQTLNMVGARFDVDTSAGNVWVEVQEGAVPVSSVGVYTHRVENGAELSLGPGATGSIFAGNGSVVRVTAGEYAFDSIVLAEGARFVADESLGDVQLSVRGALVADGGAQIEFVGGAVFLTESLDGIGQSLQTVQNRTNTPRGFGGTPGSGGGGGGGGLIDDLLDDLADDPDGDGDTPDGGDDAVVPSPGVATVGLVGFAACLRRRR